MRGGYTTLYHIGLGSLIGLGGFFICILRVVLCQCVKEKTINDIKDISSKAIKATREWGRPTSENIKDIGILQLDLNEDEIIDLLDYHKNNPVMVKELQKYARNKGMKKAPYLQYDTVENRIEKIKKVQDIILKGISSNHVYWNMYIRNKEAMDKLIEPIGG